jgi:hypothetical protein
MSSMATDDMSDGKGFSMEISEFVKTLRATPVMKAVPEPLLTYTQEDPWAFLKRIKRVTVTPNPNSLHELIQECRDGELIDMYEERRQREKGETPKVDLEAIEALNKSELINLYEERRLRKRK